MTAVADRLSPCASVGDEMVTLRRSFAQQAFDFLAVGGRQRAVVQRDAEPKAFEDVAVGAEPLLAERDRGLQQSGIGVEQ